MKGLILQLYGCAQPGAGSETWPNLHRAPCPLAEVLLPQLLHTSQLEPGQSLQVGSMPISLHVSPFCPMPRAGSWEMSYARDPTTACRQLLALP